MYKPLPNGITIKESNVQGLGVFATKDFDADVILGIVHILNKNFPHGAIRTCLLYTSPSPRDQRGSRMPSSA